jgi:hypothetical protein
VLELDVVMVDDDTRSEPGNDQLVVGIQVQKVQKMCVRQLSVIVQIWVNCCTWSLLVERVY